MSLELERQERDITSGPDPSSALAAIARALEITRDIAMTDMGMVDMFVRRYGESVRYCPELKSWFYWDRRRWVRDGAGFIMEVAKETTRSMLRVATGLPDEDFKQRWIQFAAKRQSFDRLRCMVELAKTVPAIVVRSSELDRDRWLFNCLSGTLNLRTGQVRPPRPEDLITKLAPVEFGRALVPVHWLEFLSLAMNDDEDMIGYLQRCIGMSLTGDTGAKVMFICHGSGDNGKTVFSNVLQLLTGEYCVNADAQTFMDKNVSGIRSDLVRLKGARIVRTAETNQGNRLNEGLIKQLSGGNPITARTLFSEPVEFYPEFKPWLETNHRPIVFGTDQAIWRRLKLIPFTVNIPEKVKALGYPAKSREQVQAELTAELGSILVWAVNGCLEWQRNGLREPEKVSGATAQYREEMDRVKAFVDECCTADPDVKVSATALFQRFKQWCEDNNEGKMTQRYFGMKLTEKGFIRCTPKGFTFYRGIRLNECSEPEHE